MAQSRIKWNKGDYISLGRAVADFNRKINRLQSEEKRLYLPETLTYSEVKGNIKSRSELNRIIRSLKRFQKEGAEELYKTEAGEEITKWKRTELSYQRSIATRRLNIELRNLSLPTFGEFSRVQMGSERKREIEAQLKSLKQLEFKKGYEFERLQRRIEFLGTSDYTIKMSYVFRKNFMEELEKLARNMPEFRTIYDYFLNIKNPVEFFKTTQRSQALEDFFAWYMNPENYANFETAQDLANYIIKEYKLY